MNELLITIYTALPFVLVLLLATLAVVGMGVGAVWPRFLVYPYLAIFFTMSSTTYGSLAVFAIPGVYTRGSGLLLFPLLYYYVLGAWCCARVSASYQGFAAPPCNIKPWFWSWLVLLAAHAAAAQLLGIKVADALAPWGFSNMVWMAPLISLILLSFRTVEQARELGDFIVVAGLARALFGLVRWAAFGGDPNNVYANMNDVHIKLTFFDINDGLVCTLAFTVAAVRLFQTGHLRRSRVWFLVEWATVAATSLCIVLAFRRAGWIGFILAFLIIMMRFPLRRRIQIAVFGAPLLGAGVVVAAIKRLGQTRGAEGLSGMVHDMQSQRFGAESPRLLELKLALADFLAMPFTGIGAWGRYTGYEQIAWQTNAAGGTFVHSGVLHIAYKAGLPGLVLLCGLLLTFALLVRRALRTLPTELLPMATAGAAGIAFLLPDFLIGTPIPQVRTTQMIALCLALPYLALGVHQPARPRTARAQALKLVPA